jgi:hypothetical protein
MAKKLTIQEVVQRVREIHGDSVILVESTYTNTSTNCTFIHVIYKEWYPTPAMVLRGQSHPKAKRRKPRLTLNTINERLQKAHGGLISIDYDTFIGVSKIATFIDKEIGEFPCRLADVIGKGVGHPDRTTEKHKNTCIKNFGVNNPSKSEKIKNKKRKTTFKNFGVENPSQSSIVREKAKKTNLSRRGVEYPTQSTEVLEKRKQNSISKNGIPFPAQIPGVALKQAKSSNICVLKKHWKTEEELVCQGGYESKTVDYLNINKINFNWQPETFNIPLDVIKTKKGNEVTYRPDFYLPDQDVWVEIKGYMRGDAQVKWDWFKSEHPTAELWNQKKLEEMGIL